MDDLKESPIEKSKSTEESVEQNGDKKTLDDTQFRNSRDRGRPSRRYNNDNEEL